MGNGDLSVTATGRRGLREVLDEALGLIGRGTAQGLRLLAHGNSGSLQFASEGLSERTVGAFRTLQGKVQGAAQLHGCAVGSAIRIRVRTEVDGINTARQVATPGSLQAGYLHSSQSVAQGSQLGELDSSTGRDIRSGAGVRFLIAFADALGLPVTGAVQAQDPDRQWRFEGATITAWPLGALQLTIPANDPSIPGAQPGTYNVPR